MAEKGIFNKQGLTPLESVYNTNVWDIFYYLSIETAQDTLKAEMQEIAHKEAMRKRK